VDPIVLEDYCERIAGSSPGIEVFDDVELPHGIASKRACAIREDEAVLFDHSIVSLDRTPIFFKPGTCLRSPILRTKRWDLAVKGFQQDSRQVEACRFRGRNGLAIEF
jgi:hypothetical protein